MTGRGAAASALNPGDKIVRLHLEVHLCQAYVRPLGALKVGICLEGLEKSCYII